MFDLTKYWICFPWNKEQNQYKQKKILCKTNNRPVITIFIMMSVLLFRIDFRFTFLKPLLLRYTLKTFPLLVFSSEQWNSKVRLEIFRRFLRSQLELAEFQDSLQAFPNSISEISEKQFCDGNKSLLHLRIPLLNLLLSFTKKFSFSLVFVEFDEPVLCAESI